MIVYCVPAHKPLTLFPVAIGPIGENEYVNGTEGFNMAVPSQPGTQLAFVNDVTVTVGNAFTLICLIAIVLNPFAPLLFLLAETAK